MRYVTGKGVGGSVLLNNMKAVRPTSLDTEEWGPGWSWDALEPFLRRSIGCAGDPSEGSEGDVANTAAPLAYVRHGERSVIDGGLNIRFYEACEAAGFSPSMSFNQGSAEGFSFYESLVTPSKSERVHLEQGLALSEGHTEEDLTGLVFYPRLRVHKLLFEKNRVTGVECSTVNGSIKQVFQGKHVIVALGTIESPALLMRSGIGPNGSVVNNPDVGTNLIASTSVSTQFKMCVDPSTNAMMPKNLHWRHARYMLQQWKEYQEFGSGAFSALFEGGLFLRSHSEVPQADLSIDFLRHCVVPPVSKEAYFWKAIHRRMSSLAVSFIATHHYPRSRGYVRLVGEQDGLTDSGAPALSVSFGIFSDEENYDLHRMDDGLQWISRLTSLNLPSQFYTDEKQQHVSPFYSLQLRMTHPRTSLSSEESVAAFLKDNVELTGNLFGTCSLGTVVEEGDLTVKGVQGVHVADASVVPKPTKTSSWLVSAAIGERVSSFL